LPSGSVTVRFIVPLVPLLPHMPPVAIAITGG
jgi:hypothetical protein